MSTYSAVAREAIAGTEGEVTIEPSTYSAVGPEATAGIEGETTVELDQRKDDQRYRHRSHC